MVEISSSKDERPLVHLILIQGNNCHLRQYALEWVNHDLPSTFRKAVQLYGNRLFEQLRLAVVIIGTEVNQYKPEMFKWLCGVGPNPQDPEWMGQLTFTPRQDALDKNIFEQQWPLPPFVEGQTSRQLVSAPLGAIFVWCKEDLNYVERLAHHLGLRGPKGSRTSTAKIRIVRPSWLEHTQNVAQCRKELIILDHACQLTPLQSEMYHQWEKNRDKRN